MPLDPTILASDQYLGLDRDAEGNLDDVVTERLTRTLAAAVARCESYTGRRVEPTIAAAETVRVRANGSIVRVPDVADLAAVQVLDGPYAGVVATDTVELSTWGAAKTAVMLRLPIALSGRPLVAVTGQFGMDPIPADLEDAIYTYAATRWREAEAQFGDTVRYADDGTLALPRRLPTVVRGVWDEYRLPAAAMTPVTIRTR